MSPHLLAAYNLARWLTRNDHDAEDVVQEAMLRAFTFFDGFRGADARSWVLKIVRNTCFTWLQTNRPAEIVSANMDELSDVAPLHSCSVFKDDPELLVLRKTEVRQIDEALSMLPVAFREVIVLRELEGLSYKEIANVTDSPIGTVMSRLARARAELRRALTAARKS
jgi:RNA polymerase sigma-70 factor, ECF subfamily